MCPIFCWFLPNKRRPFLLIETEKAFLSKIGSCFDFAISILIQSQEKTFLYPNFNFWVQNEIFANFSGNSIFCLNRCLFWTWPVLVLCATNVPKIFNLGAQNFQLYWQTIMDVNRCPSDYCLVLVQCLNQK